MINGAFWALLHCQDLLHSLHLVVDLQRAIAPTTRWLNPFLLCLSIVWTCALDWGAQILLLFGLGGLGRLDIGRRLWSGARSSNPDQRPSSHRGQHYTLLYKGLALTSPAKLKRKSIAWLWASTTQQKYERSTEPRRCEDHRWRHSDPVYLQAPSDSGAQFQPCRSAGNPKLHDARMV